MSVADNANTTPTLDSERVHALFSQLDAQQVETFYQYYQQWQLKQQSVSLQKQLVTLEQQIVDNRVLMQLTQPSPIALAALTRLQSYGVEDVDLLDSMLERGDTWLDHTLQLLEQCERLDVIHGNYTEWCRHALEDAYNWLDSIDEVVQQEQTTQAETSDDTTEALLLQKLMSEDETVKVPAIKPMSEPDMHEESVPVGTDVSRPSHVSITDKGHDEAVPTDTIQQHVPIPSMLSFPTVNPVLLQEDIPTPAAPVHETPPEVEQQKSPKHGLVFRILARAWRT